MRDSAVNNIALLVGDETGVLHSFSRGLMTPSREIDIASASKLPAGITIWKLIEAGRLAQTTRPQAYLGFWTNAAGDLRSEVTLDQLLGFTSGFAPVTGAENCAGNGSLTLVQCVTQIYNRGVLARPGTVFAYGGEHLQIAAAMVEAREGLSFEAVMRDRLLRPLGLTQTTRFPAASGGNPRIAGGMQSSGLEYGLILQALLGSTLITDKPGYLADRIEGRIIGYRPEAAQANGIDWHYGAGFWRVCNKPVWDAACEASRVISSPGAFGFTPWVDFDKRYWAIVIMEQPLGANQDPARSGVALQVELQPLIEQILAAR